MLQISYLPFRPVCTEKYFLSVLVASLDLRPQAASKTSGKYFSVRTSQTANNLYIFCFSETHLSSNWSDKKLQIKEFNLISKDRTYASGEGILINIPKSIDFQHRNDLLTKENNCPLEFIWFIWLSYEHSNFKPLIAILYQLANNTL